MLPFLARRLTSAFITLALATGVVFIAIHLLPGDPVAIMLGEQAGSDPAVSKVRAQLGLTGRWARSSRTGSARWRTATWASRCVPANRWPTSWPGAFRALELIGAGLLARGAGRAAGRDRRAGAGRHGGTCWRWRDSRRRCSCWASCWCWCSAWGWLAAVLGLRRVRRRSAAALPVADPAGHDHWPELHGRGRAHDAQPDRRDGQGLCEAGARQGPDAWPRHPAARAAQRAGAGDRHRRHPRRQSAGRHRHHRGAVRLARPQLAAGQRGLRARLPRHPGQPAGHLRHLHPDQPGHRPGPGAGRSHPQAAA